MRRVPNLGLRRRFVVATTIVALAFGAAGFSQPDDDHAAGGTSLTSTHNAAIAEAPALASTFTERRPLQRSDLLLAVMFAVVVWALPRREETVADRGRESVPFGRLLLVRDRGPPSLT